MRFLFAADFCRAFESFGVLAALINHLCAAIGLSIAESALASINYDRTINVKLQGVRDCDIQTHPSFTGRYLLSIENTEIKRLKR